MSGKIEVVEVTTKALLRKFVDYPNQLYKDSPYFVPAFFSDDMADWDRKKNPAFQYCDARCFLAYRDGEIVGRIGAILSYKANEKWNTKRMRFSQVDFIDDPEVSDALFATVEAWAREKGMNEVHGPLGFCDMDREGMLVDGFNLRSMFITYYNHPYYIEHMKRLGYVKDADWVEYMIPVPKEGDENWVRLSRLAEAVMRKGHYHKAVVTKRSDYRPYIRKLFKLVNECYAPLYGVVELNEDQINKYADKFIPLINPDFCCLVLDEKEELVAMGVCAPSMAAAMQKCRGKLFPTGWIGVLRSLHKNDTADMFLIAVRPDLQGTAVNAIVMDHMTKSCRKNGIGQAETGPMLELNKKVLDQWKMFHLEPHKRRRCFVKKLED